MLKTISSAVHRSFPEILDSLPGEVVFPSLSYPGIRELISVETIEDKKMRVVFERRFGAI
jgi:hypothetical protein